VKDLVDNLTALEEMFEIFRDLLSLRSLAWRLRLILGTERL